MSSAIAFVENITSTEKLDQITDNVGVFSFDYITHNVLTEAKIDHVFADDYLTKNDRLLIFDLASSLHNWYKNKELYDLNFDNINILEILDTAELHMLLIHHVRNFLISKRIIEKEKPKKIIITQSLHNTLNALQQKYDVELEIIHDRAEYYLEWDKIELKFNVGSKLLSFKISRNTYDKIKSAFENIVCTLFGLWSKPSTKTKTVLFLEINPIAYDGLLKHLHNSDKNILFFNRRRPAIWNVKSINLLRKNHCKLVNTSEIEKAKSKEISSLINYYSDRLKQLWSNDESLMNDFVVEGISMWPLIKQKLFDTYMSRLNEYVKLLVTAKTILEQNNVSCILCSNVFGETEKTILDVSNNPKPSILLEHAYANYTPEIERFDVLSMYDNFRDKIAVWGETQKQYLVKHKHVDPNRIIVCGSPRHDSFFTNISRKNQTVKTVLLTIHSINHVSGQATIRSYVEFDNLLRRICDTIKSFKNVILVVKLHPNQDIHNQEIKKLINKIDNTIVIYQSKPIKELISSCDLLINISPEGFDPSTVLLESLILNKPTMNIVLDEQFYDFQYDKDGAIMSISASSDLNKHLHDFVFDATLQQKLVTNGKHHIDNYLANHGTASKHLANYIDSY